jgi:hypothetical protein
MVIDKPAGGLFGPLTVSVVQPLPLWVRSWQTLLWLS